MGSMSNFLKGAYLSGGEGHFFVSNRLLGHLVGRLGHPRHRLVLGSLRGTQSQIIHSLTL